MFGAKNYPKLRFCAFLGSTICHQICGECPEFQVYLKPLCGHTIRAKLCLTFFWFPCSPSGTRVRLYFRSVNNSEARLRTPLENLIEDSGHSCKSDGRFRTPHEDLMPKIRWQILGLQKFSKSHFWVVFRSEQPFYISYSHFFRSHGSYFEMKNCDTLPLNVKCVAEIDKIDQQSIIKLTPCNC